MECEVYLKNKGVSAFAFRKSNGINDGLFFDLPMKTAPDSYGLLLEHCYEDVKYWAQTGTLKPSIYYLEPLLYENLDIILEWVDHNVRHEKLLMSNGQKTTKPEIKFEAFCSQLDSLAVK